jgi:hypothetical protein
MKNWILDDINVGMFVIPEGFNVFGNPHQCLTMVHQIAFNGIRFGFHNFSTGIQNGLNKLNGEGVIAILNENDMRLLTRKELAHLVLYMDQDYFGRENSESFL